MTNYLLFVCGGKDGMGWDGMDYDDIIGEETAQSVGEGMSREQERERERDGVDEHHPWTHSQFSSA